MKNIAPSIFVVLLLLGFSVATSYASSFLKKDSVDWKSKIQFKGNIESFSFFSNAQNKYQDLNRNYSYLSIQSTLSVLQVPISVNYLGSTLNSRTNPMNLYSIGFNQQLFRENIEQILAKNLERRKNELLAKNVMTSGAQQQLNRIQAILNSEAAQMELKQLDYLEIIEKSLQDSLINPKNKTEIQKTHERLSGLKAKKAVYDDLLTKKTGLEKLLSQQLPIADSITKIPDLEDVKNDKNVLKRAGLNPGMIQYLLPLQSFTLGNAILFKGNEFLFNGIPLNGIDVEYAPKKLYFSYTSGFITNPINNLNVFAFQKQKVTMYGIGIQTTSSFLKFYSSFANDVQNSPTISPSKTSNSYVNTGISGKISFLENKLTLLADVFGSQTRIQNESFLLQNKTIDSSSSFSVNTNSGKNWMSNILNQERTENLKTGISSKINVSFNLKNSNFVVQNKRVSPLYETVGNPYLLKDLNLFMASYKQYLFKRMFSFHIKTVLLNNNLSDNQPYKTKTSQFHYSIGIHIPKLPKIQLSYHPTIQKSDKQVFKNDYYLFFMNHDYFIKNTRQSSYLQAFYTKNTFASVYSVAANHSSNLKKMLVANASCSFTKTQSASFTNSFYTFGTSMNYKLKEKHSQSLGVNFTNGKTTKRISFQASSNWLISPNFSLKAMYQLYQFNYLINNHFENSLSISLVASW